jgi:glucosyl-3-phosphoglycerate synthase
MTLVDVDQSTRAASSTSGARSVAEIKGGMSIAVCIPARDESVTIEPIVTTCRALGDMGLLDEIIVVDDGSVDDTARRARRAGATVVTNTFGHGKGQALRCGLEQAEADVIVFLDADVANFSERFVTRLISPLLGSTSVQMVKAAYERPLDGTPGEGGRVTELVARPLLDRFFPELADVAQPLAGETAVRRGALEDVVLADGYGIEIGLLIDVYARFRRHAIAEADLGERVHRNRPLRQLRPHAREVLDAVLRRIPSLEKAPGGTQ